MAALTISDNDGTISFAVGGTASAGPFAFDFVYFEASEIKVKKVTAAGVETIYDAADYMLTGVAADDGFSSGSVTLDVAVSDVTITIYRELLVNKAVNLGTTGKLNVARLNTQMSRLYAIVQDLRRGVDLSLKLPPEDVGDDVQIDATALRLSKYIGFDSAGNLTLIAGTASQTVSAAMGPVVIAATLALARTAMGVPGLAENTFTGAQTLPGNASNALEAVPKQQAETIAAAAALAAAPVGACFEWPNSTPPTNYLERNGAAISRTTYASLFAVLVTQPGFVSANFTVTIASPGLVTDAGHGYSGGERLRLSTTGALPTGLNTTDDFFVIVNDTNSYWLATTEANAAAGTKINTSGSQSGTHSRIRSLYGLGDGSTTFKLPDDRDLFMRGLATSGRAIGSYQGDDNKAHTHTVEFTAGNLAGGAGGNMAAGTGSFQTTSSSGGTEARPKNRAYLPIIKYQ